MASVTFGAGLFWWSVGFLVFIVGIYVWCLCHAADLGDELWGKPWLDNVRPIGERAPREAQVIDFPRRRRVVEDALDEAGAGAQTAEFEWPPSAA